MANAELMIPFLKRWEGGYVNDKDDKGGCTMAGITIGTYRKYYGSKKTCNDLKFITQKEWLHIFKKGYWDKMQADKIENQSVAQLCVDMCWGSGPITSIKKIQSALGLKADGIVGPKTLEALNLDPEKVFKTLWDMRKAWFERIAKNGNNQKFLKGWLNRLNDIKFVR